MNVLNKIGGSKTSVSQRPRVDYVDLLKGITILWIIWVHTDCYDFGSYRNPIFFFASGIFFKLTDYKTFFTKRLHSLLIPFLFFYIASLPFRIIIDLWDCQFAEFSFDWSRVWDLFMVEDRSDYLSLNVPIWFLLTLFWIQTYSTLLFKLGRSVILFTTILALVFSKQILAWATPFMINNAMYWYAFFALGYLIGKPLIQYLAGGLQRKIIVLIIALATVIIALLGAPLTGEFSYVVDDLKYSAFAVFFMTFWSFFDGSKRLEFLRYFGKNSLLVLGAHLWILIPFARLAFRLTRMHEPIIGLICAIITAVLLVPLINWMNKRIPSLVGKTIHPERKQLY
jgi:hypothetical protein